jgi:hypothetical protein
MRAEKIFGRFRLKRKFRRFLKKKKKKKKKLSLRRNQRRKLKNLKSPNNKW